MGDDVQDNRIGGRRSGGKLRVTQGLWPLTGVVCGKDISREGMPGPRPTAQQWWPSACPDPCPALSAVA